MMLEKESAVSFVYGYVNDFDSNRDDFSELEAQLRDQRATPTTDELDRVKRRATAGDVRPRTFTLARLAMVSLVSGAVLVGGSAASLALSGPSGDGSAGRAQYPTTTGGPTTDHHHHDRRPHHHHDRRPDALGYTEPGRGPAERRPGWLQHVDCPELADQLPGG